MGGVFAIASVIGPLIGGFITQQASWRWIFYVNLPSGAAALAVIAVVLHDDPAERRSHRIDYEGVAALALGAGLLILALTWGGTQYPWDSWQIIGSLRRRAGRGGGVHLHRAPCRRAAHPAASLPDLDVQDDLGDGVPRRHCRCSAHSSFCRSCCRSCTGSRRRGPGWASCRSWAVSLVASIGGGRTISKLGRYRVFPIAGTALMTLGMYLLSLVGASSSYLALAGAMIVLGVGLGLVMPVLVLAVQNAVDPRDMGTATAASTFFRSIGGSFGVAIFGAIFLNRLAYWLPRELACERAFEHRIGQCATAPGACRVCRLAAG